VPIWVNFGCQRQHLDWKQQAKDLHMLVQHQTTQGEKTYETKHECYNLLNCEFEEQCKDACFSSNKPTSK